MPKAAREGLHALSAGSKGEIFCVWLDLRNEQPEVFGSNSKDGGKTPWVTANAGEVWMTWVSRENGDLRVKTPSHELPEIIASRANDPVIGALVGKTGPVVLAWESHQEKTCHLAIQVFPPARSQK